ncbi:hypothetical protein RRG08_044073 [Elysia crispata]|uniref:Uncharacterized protein n=1 Tax=Elysia crispata TaxID=231223 RepID=A0AAE1BFG8_9GAST|nr:hypothetical protein RRG08_044073 [Elysia crispata]
MLNSILKWGILEQDNSAARDSLSREALPERLVFKPLTHPTVDGDREYFGLLSLFAMKTAARVAGGDPRYLGRVLGLDHGDFGHVTNTLFPPSTVCKQQATRALSLPKPCWYQHPIHLIRGSPFVNNKPRGRYLYPNHAGTNTPSIISL